MIGQHISATLWRCHYSFTRPPKTPDTVRVVNGMVFLTTADPTGGDLLDVTKRFVLGGKPEELESFRLMQTERLMDVTGLAQLIQTDCGWPGGLDVGAAVIDATGRAQAAIADLRRALALKDIAIAELEAKLTLLQGREEGPRA